MVIVLICGYVAFVWFCRHTVNKHAKEDNTNFKIRITKV